LSDTIIVLEDDASCMKIMCAVLEQAGYRPVPAADLDDCLRWLERAVEPVPLLVADQLLPTCTGTEVALVLTAQQPGIKVLFVSATPPDAWAPREQEQLARLPKGSTAIMGKPFMPSDLLAQVGRLLQRRVHARPA
jgi:DNA-binding response OmpR family regulator